MLKIRHILQIRKHALHDVYNGFCTPLSLCTVFYGNRIIHHVLYAASIFRQRHFLLLSVILHTFYLLIIDYWPLTIIHADEVKLKNQCSVIIHYLIVNRQLSIVNLQRILCHRRHKLLKVIWLKIRHILVILQGDSLLSQREHPFCYGVDVVYEMGIRM